MKFFDKTLQDLYILTFYIKKTRSQTTTVYQLSPRLQIYITLTILSFRNHLIKKWKKKYLLNFYILTTFAQA